MPGRMVSSICCVASFLIKKVIVSFFVLAAVFVLVVLFSMVSGISFVMSGSFRIGSSGSKVSIRVMGLINCLILCVLQIMTLSFIVLLSYNRLSVVR